MFKLRVFSHKTNNEQYAVVLLPKLRKKDVLRKMKVIADFSFKVDGINNQERIHHICIPAFLYTSDNCLETDNLQLVASEFCSLTVDCSEGGICDSKFQVYDND